MSYFVFEVKQMQTVTLKKKNNQQLKLTLLYCPSTIKLF